MPRTLKSGIKRFKERRKKFSVFSVVKFATENTEINEFFFYCFNPLLSSKAFTVGSCPRKRL